MRRFCILATALALAACAQTARDSLDEARQALAEARYADAIAAADTGLSGDANAVTRDGRGDETLAQIEKLAAARPEQMPATQYASTADQLRAAGQGTAAIQVMDAGLQRFPEDQALLDLIEQAKAAPAPGSDELEMLRSLGYVD
jgi:hypothetical protein